MNAGRRYVPGDRVAATLSVFAQFSDMPATAIATGLCHRSRFLSSHHSIVLNPECISFENPPECTPTERDATRRWRVLASFPGLVCETGHTPLAEAGFRASDGVGAIS